MNLLRHPLGLASMASLPLLLFATAFVLLAGVLLFAFRDINAMLEQAAEPENPRPDPDDRACPRMRMAPRHDVPLDADGQRTGARSHYHYPKGTY